MSGQRVHFEIFIRKIPGGAWILHNALDDRAAALESAKALMDERAAVAVRVSKETFHEESGGFDSIVIQALGAAEVAAKSRPKVESQLLCASPQDLYTFHARERIGRLLEAWLAREQVTPFELLHRPDLVERLEASAADLRQALQKVATPEAHARNKTVTEMVRVFEGLVDRASERLAADAKRGAFPKIDVSGFAAAAESFAQHADRGYLLGGGVANALAKSESWSAKVTLLLDLADAAPASGPARNAALHVLMQPLAEILEARPGIDEVLGTMSDLGARLAAMTRLAAHQMVERLIKIEPSVAKIMPELPPLAARLATWLSTEAFQDVRAALGRRVLRELMGPRRLKPGDAGAEIHVLRALGMALTAAAGKLLPQDDVQAAFTSRSRTLITGDFVEAYLAQVLTPCEEVEALIWLAENIIGAANKREAAGWLRTVVESIRFEKDLRGGMDSPAQQLARLAKLQRGVSSCGLAPEDSGPITIKLGLFGGEIEARAKIVSGVARANAPAVHRLLLLLKLAVGDSAPLGPAANRARQEAMRLVKLQETRAALSAAPEQMQSVRDLIQRSSLAA